MLSAIDASLTTTPQNVVVLRDQDAALNCATNRTSSTGQNLITWNYDNDIVSYVPCTSQVPGFVTSPPDSATDCNLRALASNEYGISGVYRCELQGSQPSRETRAVATVIVLGQLRHSSPRDAMLARCMPWPCVRPSVFVRVCYKSELSRNGWTNRAGFGMELDAAIGTSLRCVVTKFGYRQSRYTFLEHCSALENFPTVSHCVVTITRRPSSLWITPTTVGASALLDVGRL